MPNTKTYLIRPEAADELRISVRKLDQLIAEGELEVIRLGPRRILISRQALDQFVGRYAPVAAGGAR